MLLLLACARPVMGAAQRDVAAGLLRGPVDWDLLLLLATRHALVPLVERQLATHFAGFVPAPVRDRLGRAARAALARSVMLTEELLRVLAALRTSGVPALAYKGPALAHQIYGDVTLRTFRDLDVLVTRADFFRARAALEALGYRASPSLTAAQEEALMRSECDQALVHETSGALVELHWAVTPPHFSFPLETEALLARAVTVELAGVPVAAPGPEDLLLLLAMNGAKDLWTRLEPAALIAALLARGLDCAPVLARARTLRAERMLALGLTLAAELFGVVPPELLRERPDPGLAALVREARARLLSDEGPGPGLLEIARFRLRTREHWADRLRYCALWAITPTPADAPPVPRPLWPVAYAWRPLRLLARTVAARNEGR
jgi:hypothetical protein